MFGEDQAGWTWAMIPALRVIRTESESSTGATFRPNVDSVRMGRFRELLFGTAPESAASADRAVKRAEVLKHWKNRLNHPLLQVLTNWAGSL